MDTPALNLIDFESSENIFIPNPFWSSEQNAHFNGLAASIEKNAASILVATSGSSDQPKLVVIKKIAFLVAADAVNATIHSSAKDVWLQTLPLFHVGGLSICARSFLSGSKLVSLGNWNVQSFLSSLESARVTVTSLVPTQLFDLMKIDALPSGDLRAVFIGGGSLSFELAQKAVSLGWPIYNSYGMTETSALIAARKIEEKDFTSDPIDVSCLELLPHADVRTDSEGRLSIKGDSLFSGYVQYAADNLTESLHKTVTFTDPKANGWFLTDDQAKITGAFITPLGRVTDTVKISGELLNLSIARQQAAHLLDPLTIHHTTIIAVPHERTEHEVVLICEKTISDQSEIMRTYNAHLPRFAQITRAISVDIIPRSSLGKILFSELKKYL